MSQIRTHLKYLKGIRSLMRIRKSIRQRNVPSVQCPFFRVYAIYSCVLNTISHFQTNYLPHHESCNVLAFLGGCQNVRNAFFRSMNIALDG